MKIKIFGSKNLNKLEWMVNKFCELYDVIDMQHTALTVNGYVVDRIFVMYNERDKTNTGEETEEHNCTNCRYANVPFCCEPCSRCSLLDFNHWEEQE